MLYVTTTNRNDVYTPRHTLCRDRDKNGGLYVPFSEIRFSSEYILNLKEKSYGECISEILNLFFSTKLTGWEVDFSVGRKPVRLVAMNHKILIGELFNNPGNAYTWIAGKLRDMVVPSGELPPQLSQWTGIAVRIAILFGIFGELQRIGLVDSTRSMDISLAVDDFSGPMAVFYAKKMGLPVGNILFGCNENSAMWDILHHGELHVHHPIVRTETPECDHNAPSGLERLLYERLGSHEAIRYRNTVDRKGLYSVSEEARAVLSEGFSGAVISQKRLSSVIRNVYGTNRYSLDPYGALAFGALQDFRATHNEVGPALILSDYAPQRESQASKQTEG